MIHSLLAQATSTSFNLAHAHRMLTINPATVAESIGNEPIGASGESALASLEAGAHSLGLGHGGCVHDKDGLAIPTLWAANECSIGKWEKLPLSWRHRRSQDYLAELSKAASAKPKTHRQGASKFTTAYAIDWGRRQGWRLVDRERWDHYNHARSHDVAFGMDAIFVCPLTAKRIGIQGAGRSERAIHFRRFEQCGAIKPVLSPEKVLVGGMGAVEAARAQNIEIWYLEFDRGEPEPILRERWA